MGFLEVQLALHPGNKFFPAKGFGNIVVCTDQVCLNQGVGNRDCPVNMIIGSSWAVNVFLRVSQTA